MSVHKCPVCERRGQVPAGFYFNNSAATVLNTCPETCRSCNGKGIIFEYGGNDYNSPYTPYPCDLLVGTNSCSNCGHNDGMVYTSNPVKYKCTLTNEWHTADYKCDSWCQQFLQLFTGTDVSDKISEYLKYPILNAGGTEDSAVEFINGTNTAEHTADE